MNPWIAILVFLASVGDDVLCVFYIRRTNSGKILQAGILSGLLTALIGLEVLIYVGEWKYLLPNILGSAIGTPIALWIDDKWPAKRARDKQGKFKTPMKTAEIIQRKEELL